MRFSAEQIRFIYTDFHAFHLMRHIIGILYNHSGALSWRFLFCRHNFVINHWYQIFWQFCFGSHQNFKWFLATLWIQFKSKGYDIIIKFFKYISISISRSQLVCFLTYSYIAYRITWFGTLNLTSIWQFVFGKIYLANLQTMFQ